jgi:hypothetical protein
MMLGIRIIPQESLKWEKNHKIQEVRMNRIAERLIEIAFEVEKEGKEAFRENRDEEMRKRFLENIKKNVLDDISRDPRLKTKVLEEIWNALEKSLTVTVEKVPIHPMDKAADLESVATRIADGRIERQLEELRKQFFENVQNSPVLKDIDAREVWLKIKDSIRREMIRNPQDWRD